MIYIILIAIIIIAAAILFSKPHIPEIDKCDSIEDIVMSINHGRVHPFHTGMNLEQVKNIVKKSCHKTTEFENSLHLQELMGSVRGVAIPLTSQDRKSVV